VTRRDVEAVRGALYLLKTMRGPSYVVPALDALARLEARLAAVEWQRDEFYDDYDKAQDRLVKTQDRLAEVARELDELKEQLEAPS